jgi:hypothetical protein
MFVSPPSSPKNKLPPNTTAKPPDSLPRWPNPYNRPPKDRSFLRPPPEVEGHCRLHGRHPPYPYTLAAHWLPGGAVRHLRPLWRFLRHHRRVRRECACSGALYREGAGGNCGAAEEQRAACVRTHWGNPGVVEILGY